MMQRSIWTGKEPIAQKYKWMAVRLLRMGCDVLSFGRPRFPVAWIHRVVSCKSHGKEEGEQFAVQTHSRHN